MTFKQFNDQIKVQFEQMQQYKLFRLNVTGQQIWDAYIQGFTPEENPIFRDPNSSSHQCNNDQNFIRRYGNIVAIKNNQIVTMFDIDVTGTSYEGTVNNIKKVMSAGKVCDVFFETFNELNSLPYERTTKNQKVFQLGHEKTLKKYTQEEVDKFGVVNTTDIYTFHHFYVMLNEQFVDKTGKSVESIMGDYRSSYDVFQRAMKEIPLDTLELVKDLIVQGSLLNGDSYLEKVKTFIQLKKEYDLVPTDQKDNWCWVNSYKLPIAKFRNELIGTLCVELAEGEDLNKACLNWNKRADPINYMKASAPITQKQIAEAEKFVVENDYVESFDRRFATIDDINVAEIRHMNVNNKIEKEVGLFTGVKPSVSTRHKRSEFEGLEVVNIDKFMKDILPTCSSIELFLENRFDGNLVTLTTADKGKSIFKWNNLFSWTYNGNLTGKSQLTQMVEAKGGRVDGVFRFTHSWNELEPNQSLMDLHVFMPGCELPKQFTGGPNVKGRRVGWNQRQDNLSKGIQDVDYTDAAPKGYVPVENITFPDLDKMPEGIYTCMIHNWNFRNTGGKGKAEIAFQGQVFQYEYPATKNNQWVTIATVTLKDKVFTIEHHLPETNSSKEMWGLNSGEFHKVNLMCLSPNFWGDNNVGNKHYFFMLEGCHSDTPMRSFHNENLNGDLLAHRKVMEVLADTRKIEPANKQLAGIGFNATVNDSVILKLTGTYKRTIKLII